MCTAFMLWEHESGTLRTARIRPVYAASTPLKRLREGFNNDFTPEALDGQPCGLSLVVPGYAGHFSPRWG
jgi:hypothetical protein